MSNAKLVEIIGIAGAGKSTLAAELIEQFGATRATDFDTSSWAGHLMHLRYYACASLAAVGPLLQLTFPRPSIGREEVKKLLYLSKWHDVLARQRHGGRAIVADQGAVFRMATLHSFGPRALRHAEDWWDDVYERWSHAIDAVVWLDTEDDLLLERVQTRSNSHYLKYATPQDAAEFIRTYRTSFEVVMERLQEKSSIDVLRFNTSDFQPDDIVREIGECWDLMPRRQAMGAERATAKSLCP